MGLSYIAEKRYVLVIFIYSRQYIVILRIFYQCRPKAKKKYNAETSSKEGPALCGLVFGTTSFSFNLVNLDLYIKVLRNKSTASMLYI